MSDKKHIMTRPWFAVVWFVFMMVALVFVATPLQVNFGMMGLAITQIIILLFALLPILISKQKIRDVFPIKFNSVGHLVRQIIGTLFMWIGTYISVLVISIITMYFFPDAVTDVSGALSDFFFSVPFAVGFIIVAIFPAICEEALHRGYILTAMKDLKKDAWIVLVMGIIFGAFHLDPVRFLPTALLGATATYIMLKTRNIIMPVLLHFFNNATSFVMGYIFQQSEIFPETSEIAINPITQLGGTVIGPMISFAFFVPFFIVGGAALLRPKMKKSHDEEKYNAWKKRKIKMSAYAGFAAAAILMTGFAVSFIGALLSPPFLMNRNIEMTQAEGAQEVTFVATQNRTYIMDYGFSSEKGQIHVVIFDEENEIYFDIIAGDIFGNAYLELEAGEYIIRYQLVPQDVEAFYDSIGEQYTDLSALEMLEFPSDEEELIAVNIRISII